MKMFVLGLMLAASAVAFSGCCPFNSGCRPCCCEDCCYPTEDGTLLKCVKNSDGTISYLPCPTAGCKK